MRGIGRASGRGTGSETASGSRAGRRARRTAGVLACGLVLSATAFVGPAAADELYPLTPKTPVTPAENPNLPTKPTSGGTLPFTGGDVAGLAGIGGAMVLGGYAMARRSRLRRVNAE